MNGDGDGGGDWRSTLLMESRGRLVNKITETLSRHFLPAGSSPEALLEYESIAVRFEEKVYTIATSQTDYIRKISMKMLTIGERYQNQNTMANSLSIISDGIGKIPVNPAQAGAQPNQQQREQQQQEPSMYMNSGGGDWRRQLQTESRQHIVNKIMETLRRHLPFSGQEGFLKVKEIAERFEAQIYTVATSQVYIERMLEPDYLRKLSMKMLTMETDSHNQNENQTRNANLMPSGSVGDRRIPQDPGAQTTLEEHSSVMATLSQVQATIAYLQRYVEDHHSYVESQLGELRTRVDELYSRADGYAAAPVHSHVGPSRATMMNCDSGATTTSNEDA